MAKSAKFKSVRFDLTGTYMPVRSKPQTFNFNVQFSQPLTQREFTGVVNDRIVVTLSQLGVQLHEITVSQHEAVVTVVVPLNVAISSIIDTVTTRVNSVMQVFR